MHGKGSNSIGKEISPVPAGTGTLVWSLGQKGLGEAKKRQFDLQTRKVSYAESQKRDECCLTAVLVAEHPVRAGTSLARGDGCFSICETSARDIARYPH